MDIRHTWEGYQVMLALASLGQRELLTQIDLKSGIRLNRVEEGARERKPDMVVMELSRQKMEDITSGCPVGIMVTGADIMASVRNEMPGKSGTPMRAYGVLEEIQGRAHQICIGMAVLLCQRKDRCHGTILAKRADIHVYSVICGEMGGHAQYDESLDKARAYGIQGKFTTYIKGIDENYANVVRLPVGRLYREIKGLLEDREDD